MPALSKEEVDRDVAEWLAELRKNRPEPKERPQITVETQVYAETEDVPSPPPDLLYEA